VTLKGQDLVRMAWVNEGKSLLSLRWHLLKTQQVWCTGHKNSAT